MQPARVHVLGLVIFVDQLFQVAQRPVAFGPAQGRRQVIDDDRAQAPLGLGAFAGVVDDERINIGQRPQGGLGVTFRRQRQGLARQPFQVSVLAHVANGVGVEMVTQPGVESEIVVRRHQVGAVVAFFRVDVIAPGRLQGDGDLAQTEGGDSEMPAIGRAGGIKRTEKGIFLGGAPTLNDGLLHRLGEP